MKIIRRFSVKVGPWSLVYSQGLWSWGCTPLQAMTASDAVDELNRWVEAYEAAIDALMLYDDPQDAKTIHQYYHICDVLDEVIDYITAVDQQHK